MALAAAQATTSLVAFTLPGNPVLRADWRSSTSGGRPLTYHGLGDYAEDGEAVCGRNSSPMRIAHAVTRGDQP